MHKEPIWNSRLGEKAGKGWFSLGPKHKHKHKDKQVRTGTSYISIRTDARAENHFLTEFSIPASLNVKQDGGQNG